MNIKMFSNFFKLLIIFQFFNFGENTFKITKENAIKVRENAINAMCCQRIPIEPTEDPELALKIFKDHGIKSYGKICSKNKHVCQSIDRKSNQLHGDAVCGYAVKKLFPGKSLTNLTLCVNYVPAVHLKFDQKCTELERKRYENMAMCKYGHRHAFYVLNGPAEDHYYIFTMNTDFHPTVRAVLKYKVNLTTDRRPVVIQNTDEYMIADNIFGNFGVSVKNIEDSRHVCHKPNGRKNYLTGSPLCLKALEQHDRELRDIHVHCITEKIARPFRDPKKGNKIFSKPIAIMICTELDPDTPNSVIGITNGPTDNLFYVVQYFDQQNEYRIVKVSRF